MYTLQRAVAKWAGPPILALLAAMLYLALLGGLALAAAGLVLGSQWAAHTPAIPRPATASWRS